MPIVLREIEQYVPLLLTRTWEMSNLALERLVDSLQVMCNYYVYGCDHLMKFAEKHNRER